MRAGILANLACILGRCISGLGLNIRGGDANENRNHLHPMRERRDLPEIRRPDAVWILPGIRTATEAENGGVGASCEALVEDLGDNASSGTRR